jgi:hypothetical protein
MHSISTDVSLHEDPIFAPWSSERPPGELAPPEPEAEAPPSLAPPQPEAEAARQLAAPEPEPEAQAARELPPPYVPKLDTAPAPEPKAAPPSELERGDELPHPLGLLRQLTVPRLEALSRELRLARHRTELRDLLDSPMRIIRFELTPWLSPFSARSPTSAVLEIGLDCESDDRVTAWYWLDASAEGPYKSSTVPSDKLTSAWIQRSVLDFVVRVLGRR